MKRSTMTIAALVVATIATSAAAPATAQDHGPSRDREVHLRGPGGGEAHLRFDRERGPRMMINRRGGGAGGLFALVCAENGADRLEHMLLNIEQRTDPTGEQTALYDTFKSTALAAQADFASACAEARPAEDSAETRDLPDRLKSRLDVQQAHLDAMTTVLPAFEAFFDSLSDEQKQALEPRRGERRMDHRGPRAPMGQEQSSQPS